MLIAWTLFLGLLLIVNLARPQLQRNCVEQDAQIARLRREVVRLLAFPDARQPNRELEGENVELKDKLEEAREATSDPCAEQKRRATIAAAEAARSRQREKQNHSDLNEIFDVALQVGNAIRPTQSKPTPRPTAGDIVDALWVLQATWLENLQLRKSAASIPKDTKDLLGVRTQLEALNAQARKATMKLADNLDYSSKGLSVAEFIDSSTAEIERLQQLIYDKHGTQGQRIFEQLRRQLDNVLHENATLHEEVQVLGYGEDAKVWYPKPPHDPPTEDIEMTVDYEDGDADMERSSPSFPSGAFPYTWAEDISGSSAFGAGESSSSNPQTPPIGTDTAISVQPKRWFKKSVFRPSTPPLLPKVETWWGIGSQVELKPTPATAASPGDSSIPTYNFHWGPDSIPSTELAMGIVRERQLKNDLENAGIEYPAWSTEDLPRNNSTSIMLQSFAQDLHVSKLEKVYLEKSIPLPPRPQLELWTERQPSQGPAEFYPNGESPWDDRTAMEVARIEQYRDVYEQQGAIYPPFVPEPLPAFPNGEGRMEGTYWNYLQIRTHHMLLNNDFIRYEKLNGRGLGSRPKRSPAPEKGKGSLTLKRRGITI